MDSAGGTPEDEVPPWLSNECLAEILRHSEDDPGLMVEHLDISAATMKGDNYASIILRVLVTYVGGVDGAWAKRPLIVKALPANETLRRLLRDGRLFDKEIYAYSGLLPAMRCLAGEAAVVAPIFYPSERCDMLFLEDLSVRGFTMPDRKKRLDLAHSLSVLKALARFHALSFAVVKRDPDVISHFPESTFSERMREFNSHFFPTVYRSLATVIATWPGYETFSEKILANIDSLHDDMQKIILPEEGAFNVLNHGDFWINNMLFRYNEGSNVVREVCLLDYQLIRYGSPALDLQCFLASSLQDGVREEHEDELLGVYHQALADTLASVGLESSLYGLEDLKREYQKKALFGFNMGFFFLAAAVADSSEAYDMHSLTEENIKEGTANPMEKTFRSNNYKVVLQKHLLYYGRKGVI